MSARVFAFPARYVSEISSLNFAAMKQRQRMRPIAVGSLLVPVLMIWTTASLSQWQSTD